MCASEGRMARCLRTVSKGNEQCVRVGDKRRLVYMWTWAEKSKCRCMEEGQRAACC